MPQAGPSIVDLITTAEAVESVRDDRFEWPIHNHQTNCSKSRPIRELIRVQSLPEHIQELLVLGADPKPLHSTQREFEQMS